MFSLKEYREPTKRLPDYLPWAALIAPGIVLQKEPILQKTIAFRGPDLESSSPFELISSVSRLNNALKRLGSGWAYFVEAQRFQTNEYPDADWSQPAAWLVDMERRKSFQKKSKHFESSYYLTLVWKMQDNKTKKAQRVFYRDPETKNDIIDNQRDLEYFQKITSDIINIMRGVFIHVSELNDDETLTYLHSTISTHRHPVKAPDIPMYLDALLPDQPFTAGDIPMLGDCFIPTITISGFPSTLLPGILDDLNHLQIEYRWTSRFIALDKNDAKKEIEKYRKRWWSKRKNIWTLIKEEASKQESSLLDNDAANKASDADIALQELGDDTVAYGFFTSTISVCHADLHEARRRIAKIREVVQSRGFTVKDETLNSQQAWLGSLPGHVYANIRRPMINTLNLAHIMPLSAIWAGSRENKHLKELTGVGSPHMVCNTTGDTAFRLNLNVGDVGHTLLLGPTGAGKSTFLSLLEMQWLRYPQAQVVIFDKGRSARATTLAMSGLFYEPGNPDAPISFQPLKDIDQPSERIWAAQFIQNMLIEQNLELTPNINKLIDAALDSLAQDEPENRTLTVFCDNVQNLEVRDALRPYTLQGNFGQLFDADNEDMDYSHWVTIEMGHLMSQGSAVIIPALDYLFHRIEKKFDGRPTLLVLDEAWLFLSHPIFMGRIKSWLKTLRKKNVYVVFATQEVADAAESPICPTILSACQTKIYLPDDEALTPVMNQAYQKFGLSDAEITLLSRAQKKQDYYYRSSIGRRLINLDLGEAALAFAGMTGEEHQAVLDQIIKDYPPEQYAMAMLKHKGLSWALDLLKKA